MKTFQCHCFERRLRVKACFSNLTPDCNSLKECCIVFRFSCACELCRVLSINKTFVRNSLSDSLELLAQYGSIIYSIFLMRSKLF